MSPAEMQRLVDNLSRMYAVIVGLAIVEGLKKFLNIVPTGSAKVGVVPQPKWEFLPEALAVFFTILAFFHGMNRYMDATYLPGPGKLLDRPTMYVLMFDFTMFFIEAVLLLAVGLTISSERLATSGAAGPPVRLRRHLGRAPEFLLRRDEHPELAPARLRRRRDPPRPDRVEGAARLLEGPDHGADLPGEDRGRLLPGMELLLPRVALAMRRSRGVGPARQVPGGAVAGVAQGGGASGSQREGGAQPASMSRWRSSQGLPEWPKKRSRGRVAAGRAVAQSIRPA